MTKAEWQARRAEAALLIDVYAQSDAPNVRGRDLVLRVIQSHYEHQDSLAAGHPLFSITSRGWVVMLNAEEFAAWLRNNLGVAMTAEEIEELAWLLPPPSPPQPRRAAHFSFRRLFH
jgi:hypothetical protein